MILAARPCRRTANRGSVGTGGRKVLLAHYALCRCCPMARPAWLDLVLLYTSEQIWNPLESRAKVSFPAMK